MIFYLGITTIVMVLSWYVKRDVKVSTREYVRENLRSRYALVSIFAVLFLVSSLRFRLGNDYVNYLWIFEDLWNGIDVSSEVGFNVLVRGYQILFGEFTFIPIFATVAAVTIYYMLKAVYEQMDSFFYGFLLFMLAGYYINSMNTIRYYLAFAMVMYASKYMIQKEYCSFVGYVFIASTFHMTALLVIPTYWFAARKWGKIEYGIISVGVFSFLFMEDVYRTFIFRIYPYYENSMYDTNTTSFFNLGKCLGIMVFAIIFYRYVKDNLYQEFYFKMNIIGLILYSCCSFVPVISRLAYYFIWTQIFLIANIVANITSKRWKYRLGVGIGIVYLAFFLVFLRGADVPGIKLVPYRTWITADWLWWD